MISEIDAIKKTTQLMHEELLELIQTSLVTPNSG
jgi:hypothetical protein